MRRLRVTGAEAGPRVGRRVAALIMTLVAAGGVIAYAQSAGAAPSPSITQVQARINSLQAQADQAGEQYDAVSEQLTAARARLVSVRKQDGRASARYRDAQARLRQVAVASFESANRSSVAALLTSGDPAQALRQASLLDELGTSDSEQVAQYLTAARQVAAAQRTVRRTEQGIAGLRAQLAAKQAQLAALLKQSKAQLAGLNLQQQQAVALADISGGTGVITNATYTGPTNTPAGKAVKFAYEQLNCPYLWGGTGPCSTGFDCSGLMQAAWASGGVAIPRNSYAQWNDLPHVAKADLQAGDLVFFEGVGHVGIYVGNGMMIDAPSSGEVIRMHALDMPWYASNYVGAARP